MGRKSIAESIERGDLIFSRHAFSQMKARDIYIKQVYEAIRNGRVLHRHAERGGEKLIIVGERFNGDFIKVVVKDCEPPKVITVCYPYE